jgi:hypothetical protein
MPGTATAKSADQRTRQQAVSTVKQVRHLQACLWVYGNLLMPQSLLSDLVFLEKSKEVLHDFFKVWILRLRCFTAKANRSVANVYREDLGEGLQCGGIAGQGVVVVEAEHLLDTIQAMSDVRCPYDCYRHDRSDTAVDNLRRWSAPMKHCYCLYSCS